MSMFLMAVKAIHPIFLLSRRYQLIRQTLVFIHILPSKNAYCSRFLIVINLFHHFEIIWKKFLKSSINNFETRLVSCNKTELPLFQTIFRFILYSWVSHWSKIVRFNSIEGIFASVNHLDGWRKLNYKILIQKFLQHVWMNLRTCCAMSVPIFA